MIRSQGIFFLLLFFAAAGTSAQQVDKPARVKTGELKDPVCTEISGLAASMLHRNAVYIHNDSGDSSRFFAINPAGAVLATLTFRGNSYYPKGVKDCEDIAVGPGPEKGKSYIYLADIGDNLKLRYTVSIFRFQEPQRLDKMLTLSRQVVHLKYPDGARDAETVLVDPVLSLLYIVSKREETVSIYSTPLNFRDGDTLTLTKKGTLTLPGKRPSKWVVSGDISPDGKSILLKTLGDVYLWTRKNDEPIEQTLRREPLKLAYREEPQGEAIGFSHDGKGYYTISEGKQAAVYYYSGWDAPR